MGKIQKQNRYALLLINLVISMLFLSVFIVVQVNVSFGFFARFLSWFGFILVILSLIVSMYVLFSSRDYGVKWAWLLLIFFTPFLGVIVFYIYGRTPNEILKLRKKSEQTKVITKYWQAYINAHSIRSETTSITKHLNYPTYNHTLVKILEEREPIDEMIRIIESAEHHIHVQFYMMRDDVITNEIFLLLIQKAQNGVKVKVLIDYIGTLLSGLQDKTIKKLLAAGCEVEMFGRPFSVIFDSAVLYRNHRKIVVVDGKFALTGGYNLEGKYTNKNSVLPYWRDLHIFLSGDVVKQLQLIFLSDWISVTRKTFINKKSAHLYFPNFREIHQDGVIQVVPDGYDYPGANINDAYFMLINDAKKCIDIATPYFIPTQELKFALRMALRRGVRVRFLLPGVPDKKSIYAVSKSYLKELLVDGAKIYFLNDSFVHQKLLIVDNEIAAIGTSNFDIRSIHSNLELMVFLYNHNEIKKLIALYDEDIENSKLQTTNNWGKQTLGEKVYEHTLKLFSALF